MQTEDSFCVQGCQSSIRGRVESSPRPHVPDWSPLRPSQANRRRAGAGERSHHKLMSFLAELLVNNKLECMMCHVYGINSQNIALVSKTCRSHAANSKAAHRHDCHLVIVFKSRPWWSLNHVITSTLIYFSIYNFMKQNSSSSITNSCCINLWCCQSALSGAQNKATCTGDSII